MGKGQSIEALAFWLRRQLLEARWGPDVVPPEAVLLRETGAARHSLRGALALLEAEGLLERRQGLPSQVLDPLTRAGFDFFSNLLELRPHRERLALVQQLLLFRASQTVAAVELLMHQRQPIFVMAHRCLSDLKTVYGELACDVLPLEEWVLSFVLGSLDCVPQILAAHQLRRAFFRLHRMLDLDLSVEPSPERFDALFAAVDSGERARALELAHQAATHRDALYLDRAAAAFQNGNATITNGGTPG